MNRIAAATFAAALLAVAAPAHAIVYTNEIRVEDVTLRLRIQTNGKLGLIGVSDLVSLDASVVDDKGDVFTYGTTTDFTFTMTDGPFRTTATTFNLNNGYLEAQPQQIDDRVVAVMGIGGARYDPVRDEYLDGEYYLFWGRPGFQDGRVVRLPYARFPQAIAFAASAGVPEPATWGMMIAGFGMLGGALRRRRAGVPLAA